MFQFFFSEMEGILVFSEPVEGSFMVLDIGGLGQGTDEFSNAGGHYWFFWSSWTVTILVEV